MRIWCISKYAGVSKYGAPARLFFLTKEFIKLGHDAVLITSDSNHFADYPETESRYNFEIIDTVPVYWIKTKKYKKTASVSRILSWFDFERWLFLFPKKTIECPDVVVISSLSIFSIIFGYYLKKKFNVKLIFEIRDIWPLTMTEEGGFSKYHPLVLFIGWIEKIGYKVSDLIVGTMPKLDAHVENILGYRRPFFCSPLGFEFDNFRGAQLDENPFSKIFPDDKVIIGYAGSMGITNALEPFIDSIKLLRNNRKIHFMLVGSGDLKEQFEKKLKDCSNVTFLKRMEQKQVPFFLEQCDILYLATKDSRVWQYGQSMNKVVEYMLSGKPILASYTGYPSMINEANCGKFIKSKDPEDLKNAIIDMAYMKGSERVKLGQNGLDWILANRKYSELAKEYILQMGMLIERRVL